ncbi:unnamed protein product [Caenorhabditis sp. 36 PRJEB53466]|nr:unnamed protein product [Caenorhabditis sp. 36 PRJEB53466]
MFLTRSEYDRGVNTFSPEGRLFQVEYAIEAVKLGSTSIGIKTSEGVLLAAEKRSTSKLMVNDAIEKISKDVTQSVANLALQFGDDDVKASMSARSEWPEALPS